MTTAKPARFADDYLAQLERFAARSPLPRIRALHLPPAQPNNDGRGEFCAIELDDGSLGLSYVLLDDTLAHLHAHPTRTALTGTDALDLARRYASGSGIDKTLGFAAANALTRCLYDRAGFRPDDSTDSIGSLQPTPGEAIGMIGLFKPLLGRIIEAGARLTVVELKAELAGEHEGYRVTTDAEALATCTKVVSTSTLLLNDTLDRMLGCCRQARWFAMIGPSAGCLPDALFARGVTFVGGSWITDPAAFIDALRSGTRSASASKYGLTRDNYPGFEALLARL
ncbi:hypothetical protein CEW83_16390 [Parazoarcus communis]|uniref:Heavy-metal chelation domain-containing protein n=1 Tax=Parazoarcus communis TaxID=41977 RepID=A0A2U8GT51_9RHOO|nr:DUF364 domain-containing protein [Parazoarcus communis]AWI76594.1 hypothetical protein CEW83_16390 [Parazoarcus communis]